jgi:hypothetical protein
VEHFLLSPSETSIISEKEVTEKEVTIIFTLTKQDLQLAMDLYEKELKASGGLQEFPKESPPIVVNQSKEDVAKNLAQQLKEIQEEKKRQWVRDK